jgi:hypothetical protein
MNKYLAVVGCLVLLLLPGGEGIAHADEGAQVYQKVLRSVVWIHSKRGEGRLATGSGSLIDRKQRLVLTNFHVVGDNPRATVFFPAYKDDKVIAERDYYVDRVRSLGIRARVVALDRRHDLAVLQLESLPEGAQALPLATGTPGPGASVHSVGNPGGSGALWVYTPGKVRQVYFKKWRAEVEGKTVQFEAEVIETDSPTNPGDSGGPLVNDQGQLIGVTHGVATNARLLSTFIDLSEVKALLGSREVRAITGSDVIVPPRPAEAVIKDKAELFSETAIKKAVEEIRSIQKKTEREVVVETFPQVPASDRERVKEMNRDERERYFRSWAQERMRSQAINGVLVLICKEPRHLQIQYSGRLRDVFSEADTKKMVDQLVSKFKDKKYDEGLQELLQTIRDKLVER